MVIKGSSEYGVIKPDIDISQNFFFGKLAIGSVIGISDILITMSLSAFLLSNTAPSYIPFFTIVFIFGTIIQRIMAMFLSKIKSTIIASNIDTLPIISIIITTVGLQLEHASSSELFSNIFIIIPIISILTGICFISMGYFKIGTIAQYIPVPVEIGFIAGIGWALIDHSVLALCQTDSAISRLDSYFNLNNFIYYSPAIMLGLLLAIENIYIKRKALLELAMIVTLLGSICLFYLLLIINHISLKEAANVNLLFNFSDSNFHIINIISTFNFKEIHWALIANQLPKIAIVIFITLITVLFNSLAIGLVTQEEVDFNSELKVNGYINTISGFFCSLPGISSLFLTGINHKFSPTSKLITITTTIVLFGGLFYGKSILIYAPTQILYGILIFFGFSFLNQWLFNFRKSLKFGENILIATILIISTYYGIMESLLFGLIVSVIFFMVDFSKLPIIQSNVSRKKIQSNHQYNARAEEILRANENKIQIYKLQNYIFFATAYSLYAAVKNTLASAGKKKQCFIVFDFSMVLGIDTSMIFCISSIIALVNKYDAKLIFTEIDSILEGQIKFNNLLAEHNLKIFKTLDDGLEWCEHVILASKNYHEPNAISLESFLETHSDNKELIKLLLDHFHDQHVKCGEYLFRAGDSADALYYLESGQMCVFAKIDDKIKRIRVFDPGVMIGEMALYSEDKLRSASLMAESDCLVKKLTFEDCHKLKNYYPACALLLNSIISQILTDRIKYSNKIISLED